MTGWPGPGTAPRLRAFHPFDTSATRASGPGLARGETPMRKFLSAALLLAISVLLVACSGCPTC